MKKFKVFVLALLLGARFAGGGRPIPEAKLFGSGRQAARIDGAPRDIRRPRRRFGGRRLITFG